MCLYCVFTIHSKMYNVYNVLNLEYNTEHVNIAGSHKNGCYLLKLCRISRYITASKILLRKEILQYFGTKIQQQEQPVSLSSNNN